MLSVHDDFNSRFFVISEKIKSTVDGVIPSLCILVRSCWSLASYWSMTSGLSTTFPCRRPLRDD